MASVDPSLGSPPSPLGGHLTVTTTPQLPGGWIRNADGQSASKVVGGYTYTINPDKGGDLKELCEKVNAAFISKMGQFADDLKLGQDYESISVSLPKDDSDPVVKAKLRDKEEEIQTGKYTSFGDLKKILGEIFKKQISDPTTKERPPDPVRGEGIEISAKASKPMTSMAQLEEYFGELTEVHIKQAILGLQIDDSEWDRKEGNLNEQILLNSYNALVRKHNEDSEYQPLKEISDLKKMPKGVKEALEKVIPENFYVPPPPHGEAP